MTILNNKNAIIALILFGLYIMPFILLGENSYILIHDNLDSNVAWLKTLSESGMFFSNNYETIQMLMNAPRVSFGNEINVIPWLYYLFEPYQAYVINQILLRAVAFIGMYLLLNRYIFKKEFQNYSLLISLLYSLLPFWPSGGLSVAGLPLITYIFLNIRSNRATINNYVVLALFPLYSSFVLSMMFYIIFLGLVWLYDIYKRTVTIKFTIAVTLFGLLYLLINYRLIDGFIFSTDFISHRVEMSKEYYGFYNAIKESFKHFFLGQYHAHSLHIVFLPFIFVIFFFNLLKKNRDKLLIGLFLLNMVISLWYGFYKHEVWESVRSHYSFLNSINLSRFHWLTPLIWYVLFALSIRYYLLNFEYKYKQIIVNCFISLTVVFLFFKSDFIQEYKKNGICYKQFYAESLFDKIDTYIDKDQKDYRVVSLGLHPLIANYNGFYTLDGYLANYSLEYKHQFRKIIAKELDKNDSIKKYFDNWGSRCYLFSSEIGKTYLNTDKTKPSIDVNYNTKVLYEMGGRYIFSQYPISNSESNNIRLIKFFDDESSAWSIYLYEVLNN